MADAMVELGANVTVVSGPTNLEKSDRIQFVEVESAQDMLKHALQLADKANIFIATAAVADYRPVDNRVRKMKRREENVTIEMTRNADILAQVKQAYPRLYCVGFAAETNDIAINARLKLQNKNVQMMIANQVGLQDVGFNSDYNAAEIFFLNGSKSFAKMTKAKLAREICAFIATQYSEYNKQSNVSYLQNQ